jgi:hypothetical protein
LPAGLPICWHRAARTKPLALEHASPSTKLLEKWRQMFEVQEALESQKQEFARKVRVKAVRTAQCTVCSIPAQGS